MIVLMFTDVLAMYFFILLISYTFIEICHNLLTVEYNTLHATGWIFYTLSYLIIL